MQTLSYHLSFNTPAFMGNAQQSAQWRTPPIKALLRQWWRVAVAWQIDYDVEKLRERENALFGVAADGDKSSKSLVRLRLSHWSKGKLEDWPRHGTVFHPEVKNSHIGSDLYLGFGPLGYTGATTIKHKPAIHAGDSATLRLSMPEEHAQDIATALWLMHQYAALGGRSRNGWGSLCLTPADEHTPPLQGRPIKEWTRDWNKALTLDWPHAIGHDAHGLLVWKTRPFADWPQLIQELARLKIALRTQQFKFTTGKNAPRPEDRHWLSYPVTNHSVGSWGGSLRLPNSLRFKVRAAPENPEQVIGVIFHMPCLPPDAFKPDTTAITRVWQQVHQLLDKPEQALNRIDA
ncbi:MAG: hypothetical protein Q4G71_03400 [Pseudomonadota bacterium]|nr:hypothetical protein [Pseudomonadota bacterium]